MILELADRSTTRPAGIAEDVFVKVGKFHFPINFVVVDYVVDPRVPLILRRPILRTGRALIYVYGEELTIRVDDEVITFKVGQTSKYSYNDAKSINRIDVIDVACEEYVQESIPPGIDDNDLDLEGDIHLLEEFLNNDPSLSPLPSKELNVEEIKTVKSSIDEPPELELKDLPTAYKTLIGCTPYKLVYGKSCHLPIELKQKAYWALKHVNFDLKTAGDHRKLQLNELNELRDQAYENYLIYKEKMKKLHDSKIKNRIFNVGDRVLLFHSRLKIFSGKLKTRWTRPFTVAHVFSYGTIELSQADGPNFKVNGHRLKHYFGGDIPQLVVLDFQTFPMDQ
nr:reverse transcriptase domain-containing protein [Tanacetum cinerariifolium]